MAKYKTLQSVAHNIGNSFVSLLNCYKDDYILGEIQKQMLRKNINKIEIDFLRNESKPGELITEPIQRSIESYSKWLPRLVQEAKSDMELVKEAKLVIEFDLTKSRICSYATQHLENPYVCISKITDNRGKEYKSEFVDWMFPQS